MFTEKNWSQARALIERIPVGVFMVDALGQVQALNLAASFFFSDAKNVFFDDEESVGYQLYDDGGMPLHVARRPLVIALLGETVIKQEIRLRNADGQEYVLMVDASPIYAPGENEIIGAIAIFQDITARRQAEDRVRASGERARMLASLSRAFAETGNDYPGILSIVARSVVEAAGEACLIRLVSEDGAYLRVVAACLPDGLASPVEMFASCPCPVDADLEGRVLQDHGPLLVQDPLHEAGLLSCMPQASQDWITSLPEASVFIGRCAPLAPVGHLKLWAQAVICWE